MDTLFANISNFAFICNKLKCMKIKNIIFDLGDVLLDWNPR